MYAKFENLLNVVSFLFLAKNLFLAITYCCTKLAPYYFQRPFFFIYFLVLILNLDNICRASPEQRVWLRPCFVSKAVETRVGSIHFVFNFLNQIKIHRLKKNYIQIHRL